MEKFKGRSRVMPNMGNGAILSATCCIMGNRGSVGIGHERFENSGLQRFGPKSRSSQPIVEVAQEGDVVPRRRRVAIGTPF